MEGRRGNSRGIRRTARLASEGRNGERRRDMWEDGVGRLPHNDNGGGGGCGGDKLEGLVGQVFALHPLLQDFTGVHIDFTENVYHC